MDQRFEEKKLEKTIKNLITLQNCDLRHNQVKQKKQEAPSKLKTIQKELEQKQQQMDEDLSKSQSVKKEKRQIEQEIADLESRIEKSKGKLTNIKSNKEYSAALKEIEELEREKNYREDRILEIMEQADVIEAQCAAIEKEKEATKKQYEADQKAIQAEMAALEEELKQYEAENVRIRVEIDDALLKKYDYIKERKEGIGLSAVVKGICQGCHMGIPPQKFNELMRGDVLMNCPHCMRIIYWGEDERYR